MSQYKNYTSFYVNGSSHTAGGGFESSNDISTKMKLYYKKHYNVEWKSHTEVNWATRLSELINIPCVNEAKQGGGLDRAIRKTYQFIENNPKDIGNFFIILEIPDWSRIDLYYEPLKQHLVVNTLLGDHQRSFLYATTNYFPPAPNMDEIQPEIKKWWETFHNESVYYMQLERKLAGLYSFCKRLGIPIKIMSSLWIHDFYKNHCYDESDFFRLDVDQGNVHLNDIYHYARQYKKLIPDETNGTILDNHPGYFAHIDYAKLVKEYLDLNLGAITNG